MGVVVRLLGEVAAEVDGRPVDLGTPRQRCVLAALAVDAGRVVPVDRLVERVWGVDAKPRARGTLHNYISRLRQALAVADGVTIVRRSGGYALAADTTEPVVDLHRFRDLRAAVDAEGDDERAVRLLTDALGLWFGQALTGVDGEWAEAERDRLGRERLAAQHDLTDARLRLGRGGDLVVELAARAAEHPLDERIAGQHVLALHQVGRTADALEHYRRLRERLVEELGTDPGVALQDLHRRILAADPALTTTAAEVHRAPVTPAQLPAAPRLFTGRTTALAELDRALTAPDGSSTRDDRPGAAAVISVIGGTGGIGKTWLALTWAHRNLHRFPDGQLAVDLRGFGTGEPKQAADVLADFLAALGVDRDDLPADPDARAALYRSHTAGKRLVILLDNAATAEQVTPLLPGGDSCTVLVTSRHRLPALLTRHGAHPLHVDVLTDTEARALLDTALRTTADPQGTVAELIARCGGFPLALGLVAARIRTHPHLLDDIVAGLREPGLDALDSDDPDASLPAVLSWSLRHLTDEQRTAFALLGIAPGPDIDLPAAGVLTGLPARAVLRALADASLITPASGGRYTMHDLVRAYAATTAHDHLAEPVRQAALDRVVDFYLHTAHTADRLLDPSRVPILDPPSPGADRHPMPDLPAALSWLDTHHRHLLAAQHIAATRHRHDAVWHLAWVLATFHLRRGHRHDDLAVWQAAADAAEHLPDPATRILAHRILGRTHAALGRHEQAITYLHQALALAEHHPVHQAHTHHVLTWVWEQRGDDRRALEHAHHALGLFRGLDQPVWEADILNSVGWFAARLGDHDTARDHCRAALALCRRHDNPAGEANTLDSLAFIAHSTGHHDEAVDHYRQAIALFHAIGDTSEAANALDHLGHPHAALGHHDQARDAWQEALELYCRQGRHDDAARMRQQLHDLDHNGYRPPRDTEPAE